MTTTSSDEKALVPTPAEAWQRAADELLTLPSGNVALCRRPNSFFLSKSGQVPEKVRKAAETKRAAEEGNDEVTAENIAAVDLIVDFLVSKAFVRPRVSVLPGQKDALYIGAVSAEDKGFILDHFDIKV